MLKSARVCCGGIIRNCVIVHPGFDCIRGTNNWMSLPPSLVVVCKVCCPFVQGWVFYHFHTFGEHVEAFV